MRRRWPRVGLRPAGVRPEYEGPCLQPKPAFQAVVDEDELKRARQRRGCYAAVTDSEGCWRTSQMVAALNSRKGNGVVDAVTEHVAPDTSGAPRTSQGADRPISTREPLESRACHDDLDVIRVRTNGDDVRTAHERSNQC
jgi:hypothetical protein